MRLSLRTRSIFCALMLCILSLPGSAQTDGQNQGELAVVAEEMTNPAVSETAIGQLDVELVGAPAADTDSTEVIAALKTLLKALAHRDIAQVGACLSEDVTTFDARSRRFLYGKESVLAHVQKNVVGTAGEHPVKRLVVYNPMVHVKRDTAMISFRAEKELAGSNSTTLESWCSEVFERKNGQWLVLQLRTNWTPAKSRGEKH